MSSLSTLERFLLHVPQFHSPAARDLRYLWPIIHDKNGVQKKDDEFAMLVRSTFNTGFWSGVALRESDCAEPPFWSRGRHFCPLYEIGHQFGQETHGTPKTSNAAWEKFLDRLV